MADPREVGQGKLLNLQSLFTPALYFLSPDARVIGWIANMLDAFVLTRSRWKIISVQPKRS